MLPLPRGAAWQALLLLCVVLFVNEVRSEGRVVCYYTNWSVYRPGTAKFNPQNINPYLCTHLIYAFGGFTKDNQMKPFDKYQDIEQGGYAKFTGLKTYNKQLKTMIAIGGWNEASSRFSPLVANPERRQQFIKNILKFLRQNHFDGIDLDWEYPAHREGGKPRDRDNYAQFVQELRAEFERESEKTGRTRLLLTMAVPAGIEYIEKGYDIPKLNKYLDWFNVLTYDFHSSHEPSVNHHAPLYSLEEESEYNYDTELNIDYSIKYYLKAGADRDKLVLGIPTYGRSYTLINEESTEIGAPSEGPGEQGDATREKGYLAYYEICQNLKEDPDWTVVQPNPNAMGPYAFRRTQWVGYDDEDIVRKKAEYVVAQRLGGIMFWAIDNDDFRGTCTGKPYPLIEAAKEAMLEGLGLGINEVSRPSAPKKPTRARSRENSSNDSRNRIGNSPKGTEYKELSRRPSQRNRPQSTTTRAPSTTLKLTEAEGSSLYIGGRTTTPPPPTTPDPGTDFKCEEEGFFQHPRDCKKYYWCLDSGPSGLGIVAHMFTCPSGLYFNPAADSCDFARNVPCKIKKTTTPAPTSAPSTTPRPTSSQRITAATSRTSFLRTTARTTTTTTTTSTTPAPEEEYEDEEVEEEAEAPTKESEEDPKVIKELIELIRKVGGIEELEKHLLRKADGTIAIKESSGSTTGATNTPSAISKSIYDKVLSRPGSYNSFRNRLTSTSLLRNNVPTITESTVAKIAEDNDRKTSDNYSKYSSVVRSRQGPQSEGLEKLSEFDALLKEPKQYVTIQRQRSDTNKAKTPETVAGATADEPVDEEEDEVLLAEEEENISSTRKPLTTPAYVSIRRTRPTSTTSSPTEQKEEDEEEADDEQEEEENVKVVKQDKKTYASLNRNRSKVTTEGSAEDVTSTTYRYKYLERTRPTKVTSTSRSDEDSEADDDDDNEETDSSTHKTVQFIADKDETEYTTRTYASLNRRTTTVTPETTTANIENYTDFAKPTTTTTTTTTTTNIKPINLNIETSTIISTTETNTEQTRYTQSTITDPNTSTTTSPPLETVNDFLEITTNNPNDIEYQTTISTTQTSPSPNTTPDGLVENLNITITTTTETLTDLKAATATVVTNDSTESGETEVTNINKSKFKTPYKFNTRQRTNLTSNTNTNPNESSDNNSSNNTSPSSNIESSNGLNSNNSARVSLNKYSIGGRRQQQQQQHDQEQQQQQRSKTQNRYQQKSTIATTTINSTEPIATNQYLGTVSSPRPFGYPRRRTRPTTTTTTTTTEASAADSEVNSNIKRKRLNAQKVSYVSSNDHDLATNQGSNLSTKQRNLTQTHAFNVVGNSGTSQVRHEVNLSDSEHVAQADVDGVKTEQELPQRAYSWRDPRRPTQQPTKRKWIKATSVKSSDRVRGTIRAEITSNGSTVSDNNISGQGKDEQARNNEFSTLRKYHGKSLNDHSEDLPVAVKNKPSINFRSRGLKMVNVSETKSNETSETNTATTEFQTASRLKLTVRSNFKVQEQSEEKTNNLTDMQAESLIKEKDSNIVVSTSSAQKELSSQVEEVLMNTTEIKDQKKLAVDFVASTTDETENNAAEMSDELTTISSNTEIYNIEANAANLQNKDENVAAEVLDEKAEIYTAIEKNNEIESTNRTTETDSIGITAATENPDTMKTVSSDTTPTATNAYSDITTTTELPLKAKVTENISESAHALLSSTAKRTFVRTNFDTTTEAPVSSKTDTEATLVTSDGTKTDTKANSTDADATLSSSTNGKSTTRRTYIGTKWKSSTPTFLKKTADSNGTEKPTTESPLFILSKDKSTTRRSYVRKIIKGTKQVPVSSDKSDDSTEVPDVLSTSTVPVSTVLRSFDSNVNERNNGENSLNSNDNESTTRRSYVKTNIQSTTEPHASILVTESITTTSKVPTRRTYFRANSRTTTENPEAVTTESNEDEMETTESTTIVPLLRSRTLAPTYFANDSKNINTTEETIASDSETSTDVIPTTTTTSAENERTTRTTFIRTNFRTTTTTTVAPDYSKTAIAGNKTRNVSIQSQRNFTTTNLVTTAPLATRNETEKLTQTTVRKYNKTTLTKSEKSADNENSNDDNKSYNRTTTKVETDGKGTTKTRTTFVRTFNTAADKEKTVRRIQTKIVEERPAEYEYVYEESTKTPTTTTKRPITRNRGSVRFQSNDLSSLLAIDFAAKTKKTENNANNVVKTRRRIIKRPRVTSEREEVEEYETETDIGSETEQARATRPTTTTTVPTSKRTRPTRPARIFSTAPPLSTENIIEEKDEKQTSQTNFYLRPIQNTRFSTKTPAIITTERSLNERSKFNRRYPVRVTTTTDAPTEVQNEEEEVSTEIITTTKTTNAADDMDFKEIAANSENKVSLEITSENNGGENHTDESRKSTKEENSNTFIKSTFARGQSKGTDSDEEPLSLPIYHRRKYYQYYKDSPITYIDKAEAAGRSQTEANASDIRKQIHDVFNVSENHLNVQGEQADLEHELAMEQAREINSELGNFLGQVPVITDAVYRNTGETTLISSAEEVIDEVKNIKQLETNSADKELSVELDNILEAMSTHRQGKAFEKSESKIESDTLKHIEDSTASTYAETPTVKLRVLSSEREEEDARLLRTYSAINRLRTTTETNDVNTRIEAAKRKYGGTNRFSTRPRTTTTTTFAPATGKESNNIVKEKSEETEVTTRRIFGQFNRNRFTSTTSTPINIIEEIGSTTSPDDEVHLNLNKSTIEKPKRRPYGGLSRLRTSTTTTENPSEFKEENTTKRSYTNRYKSKLRTTTEEQPQESTTEVVSTAAAYEELSIQVPTTTKPPLEFKILDVSVTESPESSTDQRTEKQIEEADQITSEINGREENTTIMPSIMLLDETTESVEISQSTESLSEDMEGVTETVAGEETYKIKDTKLNTEEVESTTLSTITTAVTEEVNNQIEVVDSQTNEETRQTTESINTITTQTSSAQTVTARRTFGTANRQRLRTTTTTQSVPSDFIKTDETEQPNTSQRKRPFVSTNRQRYRPVLRTTSTTETVTDETIDIRENEENLQNGKSEENEIVRRPIFGANRQRFRTSTENALEEGSSAPDDRGNVQSSTRSYAGLNRQRLRTTTDSSVRKENIPVQRPTRRPFTGLNRQRPTTTTETVVPNENNTDDDSIADKAEIVSNTVEINARRRYPGQRRQQLRTTTESVQAIEANELIAAQDDESSGTTPSVKLTYSGINRQRVRNTTESSLANQYQSEKSNIGTTTRRTYVGLQRQRLRTTTDKTVPLDYVAVTTRRPYAAINRVRLSTTTESNNADLKDDEAIEEEDNNEEEEVISSSTSRIYANLNRQNLRTTTETNEVLDDTSEEVIQNTADDSNRSTFLQTNRHRALDEANDSTRRTLLKTIQGDRIKVTPQRLSPALHRNLYSRQQQEQDDESFTISGEEFENETENDSEELTDTDSYNSRRPIFTTTSRTRLNLSQRGNFNRARLQDSEDSRDYSRRTIYTSTARNSLSLEQRGKLNRERLPVNQNSEQPLVDDSQDYLENSEEIENDLPEGTNLANHNAPTTQSLANLRNRVRLEQIENQKPDGIVNTKLSAILRNKQTTSNINTESTTTISVVDITNNEIAPSTNTATNIGSLYGNRSYTNYNSTVANYRNKFTNNNNNSNIELSSELTTTATNTTQLISSDNQEQQNNLVDKQNVAIDAADGDDESIDANTKQRFQKYQSNRARTTKTPTTSTTTISSDTQQVSNTFETESMAEQVNTLVDNDLLTITTESSSLTDTTAQPPKLSVLNFQRVESEKLENATEVAETIVNNTDTHIVSTSESDINDTTTITHIDSETEQYTDLHESHTDTTTTPVPSPSTPKRIRKIIRKLIRPVNGTGATIISETTETLLQSRSRSGFNRSANLNKEINAVEEEKFGQNDSELQTNKRGRSRFTLSNTQTLDTKEAENSETKLTINTTENRQALRVGTTSTTTTTTEKPIQEIEEDSQNEIVTAINTNDEDELTAENEEDEDEDDEEDDEDEEERLVNKNEQNSNVDTTAAINKSQNEDNLANNNPSTLQALLTGQIITNITESKKTEEVTVDSQTIEANIENNTEADTPSIRGTFRRKLIARRPYTPTRPAVAKPISTEATGNSETTTRKYTRRKFGQFEASTSAAQTSGEVNTRNRFRNSKVNRNNLNSEITSEVGTEIDEKNIIRTQAVRPVVRPASLFNRQQNTLQRRPYETKVNNNENDKETEHEEDEDEDVEDGDDAEEEEEEEEDDLEAENEDEIEDDNETQTPKTTSSFRPKDNRVPPGARPTLRKPNNTPFNPRSRFGPNAAATPGTQRYANPRATYRPRIVNRPGRPIANDYEPTTQLTPTKPAPFIPSNTPSYERKYTPTPETPTDNNNNSVDSNALIEDLNIEALNARNKKIFDINSKKHTTLKPKVQLPFGTYAPQTIDTQDTRQNTDNENDDAYVRGEGLNYATTTTIPATNTELNTADITNNELLSQESLGTTTLPPSTTLLHVFTLTEEEEHTRKPPMSAFGFIGRLVPEKVRPKHKVVEINRIVEINSKEQKLLRQSKANQEFLKPIGSSQIMVESLPHLEQLGEISVVKYVHLVDGSEISVDGHSTVADYTPTEASVPRSPDSARNALPLGSLREYAQLSIGPEYIHDDAAADASGHNAQQERLGKALLPEVIREAVESSTISLEGLFDSARKGKELKAFESAALQNGIGTESKVQVTTTAPIGETTMLDELATENPTSIASASSTTETQKTTITTQSPKYVRPIVPLLRPESNESSPLVISIANLDKVILSKVMKAEAEQSPIDTTSTIGSVDATVMPDSSSDFSNKLAAVVAAPATANIKQEIQSKSSAINGVSVDNFGTKQSTNANGSSTVSESVSISTETHVVRKKKSRRHHARKLQTTTTTAVPETTDSAITTAAIL